MAIRNIRTYGDVVLRKKCRKVDVINERLITILDDMLDTMYDAQGIGLAGSQVGVLKRIAVIDIGEGPIYLINPEIIYTEGSCVDEEGCLSIPGTLQDVVRPKKVKVKALNTKGEEFIIEGEGLLARALCHEIDHLDGILFIDKSVKSEE